jgi:hypothetical protein
MIAHNLPRDKEVKVRLPSSREKPNPVSGLGFFCLRDFVIHL